MRKVEAVIFDWAGTIVDFGSMDPVIALKNTFDSLEIDVSLEEIRKSMGKHKKDHIQDILATNECTEQWKVLHNRMWTEEDVAAIYETFKEELSQVLATETEMMEGVEALFTSLKSQGIKVGSTTGYTKEMLQLVTDQIENQSLLPDYIVTASDVEKSRPSPDMIEKNMHMMGLKNRSQIINVGDTEVDIIAGKNAGAYSVGVIIGSSELGLSKEEFQALDDEERQKVITKTANAFKNAGADAVVKQLGDLENVIKELEGN